MNSENVRVIINQEYEFNGTLIYHDGRFFLGEIHDISILDKAKLATRTVFKGDVGTTVKIVAKKGLNAIINSILIRLGANPTMVRYESYKNDIFSVGDDVDQLKAIYQSNVTDQMYKEADAFWELDLPNIITATVWGSILKIEFDDDTYGYAACTLQFPSEAVAQEWCNALNGQLDIPALPGATE